MVWFMASANALAKPLSFLVSTAISPCRASPAPEKVPITLLSPVLAAWYCAVGFGPKYPSIRPDESAR